MLVMDGIHLMVGRTQGPTARLVVLAPQLRLLCYLIHKSLLGAKGSGETMALVMAIINFICR